MTDHSRRTLLTATTLLMGSKMFGVPVARASLSEIAIPSFQETKDLLATSQNVEVLLRRIHGIWTIAYCMVLRKFPEDAATAYMEYRNFSNIPPIRQVLDLRDDLDRNNLLNELNQMDDGEITNLLGTSARVEGLVHRLASEIQEDLGTSSTQYFEELVVSLFHAERIEILRPVDGSNHTSWFCRSFIFRWACNG